MSALRGLTMSVAVSLFAMKSGVASADTTVNRAGVVCDGSTFSFSELSASIFGANEARFYRVTLIDAYVRESLPKCSGGHWRPGCAAVVALQGKRNDFPWPTAPDVYVVPKRTLLLRDDDLLLSEATRVLASEQCIAEAQKTKVSDECAALAATELQADPSLTGVVPIAPKTDAETTARVFYGGYVANGGSYKGITESIAQAASAVAFSPPVLQRPGARLDPKSELARLEQNFVTCRNAMFYVSPTREIVRHLSDTVVDGEITVCVDTAGFAIDQPLQVTLTSPVAQTVHLLWPGELQALPVPSSKSSGVQVVHMTVAGYPRRELLRSLARHPGGPLAQFDAPEFVAKAIASQAATVEAKGLQTSSRALVDVAKMVREAPAVVEAQSKLSDAVGKPTSTVAELKAAIGAALLETRKVLDARELDAANALAKKTASDLVVDKKKQVDPLTTTEELRAVAKEVAAYPARIDEKSKELKAKGDGVLKEQVAIATAADQLCDLRSVLVPLVSEDFLTRPRRHPKPKDDPAPPFVIEYDFGGGFQGASPGRPILDDDDVFVVVHNVQPGWSIGIGVGGRSVVRRDTGLIGVQQEAPALTVDQKTGQSRAAFHALRPLDLEMQPPSTQIVALGHLSGGARYDLTVCASTSGSDDCTVAPPPGVASAATDKTVMHRVISKNTLIVHSLHYLGVRAGFGVSSTFGQIREVNPIPGAATSIVEQRGSKVTGALPLLLTIYPTGRDATELPRGVSWGFAAGLDVLKVSTTPRFYAGMVFDFWGLGITAAYSIERFESAWADKGTILAPGVTAPKTDLWLSGAFVGLTTDLDIFQAVFQKYFNPPSFPSIAPPSSEGAAK